jgi:hypothetical protein
LPFWSPTTHSLAVGHESADSAASAVLVRHVLEPAAGWAVAEIPAPTATHRELPAHETSSNVLPGLIGPDNQAVAPAVGSVVVNTLPCESTATQSPLDGHVSPTMASPTGLTMLAVDQAPAPPVGSVETSTSPLSPSLTTQKPALGQEISFSP